MKSAPAKFLLPFCLLLTGCSQPSEWLEREARILREPAQLRVPADAPEQLAVAADTLRTVNERLTPLIDIYAEDSEIARANKVAAVTRFPISRDTRRMLRYALGLSESTGGYFEITDAALRHVWFHKDPETGDVPPSAALIDSLLEGVGYQYVELTEHALFLKRHETQIDLNEFARHYIMDIVLVQLRQMGVTNLEISLQDAGRLLGPLPAQPPRTYRLTHPQQPDQELGIVQWPSAGGAYARFGWPHHYEETAKGRVARSLHPRTGQPAADGRAVWVTGPVVADAYALAQAVYLAENDAVPELLLRHPRYELILIEWSDGFSVSVSPGLADRFSAAFRYLDAVRPLSLPDPARATPELTRMQAAPADATAASAPAAPAASPAAIPAVLPDSSAAAPRTD
jgi:thiamine biosynthesis lipoprotein ApbE